jgi:serine phosphatase RsbU (regulator of sigma subunit)
MYSDGVTEAGEESGREFGEAGLLGVLQDSRPRNAETLVSRIVAALAGDQQDDVTVVAICAR